MAILYRTNPQSRSLEEELRRKGIPYHIYGGLSFYQRKEIKDVIAYLRICVNPNDETALRRIINYPARGIGETTLERVWKTASYAGISPWEVVSQPSEHGLTAAPAKKLTAFTTLIQQLRQAMTEGMDVYALTLKVLSESGMQADVFQGSDPDDLTRQQNLQELTDSINTFVQERQEQDLPAGVADYLQEVSLLTDQNDNRKEEDSNQVTLMTVHASKGLEFKAVCVAGLEENLFPSQMDLDDPHGLEEERRLFYVAMTRAGEHLALSCARSRMRYGHMEFSDPSRFLSEINPSFLHVNGRRTPNSSLQTGNRVSFHSQSLSPRPWQDTSSSDKKTTADNLIPRRLTPTRNFSFTSSPSAPTEDRKGLHSSMRKPHAQSSAASPKGTRDSLSAIQPGQKIIHERFGMGIVEKVEGKGMDTRATVLFDTAGRKQLLLRFARFQLA